MKAPTLNIFIKQLPFLQRIADRARDGYFFYLSGVCSPARYPTLAQKFRRLYETDLQKDHRYRRRKAGDAVYALLGYQIRSSTAAPVVWVLMRTDGKESIAADKSEKWRDIRVERMTLMEKFELHRHTRKDMSKPSWSWRIEKLHYQELREVIIALVRNKQDTRLQEQIDSVNTSPKFAPIRIQIKALHDLIKAEFKRTRSTHDALPIFPKLDSQDESKIKCDPSSSKKTNSIKCPLWVFFLI